MLNQSVPKSKSRQAVGDRLVSLPDASLHWQITAPFNRLRMDFAREVAEGIGESSISDEELDLAISDYFDNRFMPSKWNGSLLSKAVAAAIIRPVAGRAALALMYSLVAVISISSYLSTDGMKGKDLSELLLVPSISDFKAMAPNLSSLKSGLFTPEVNFKNEISEPDPISSIKIEIEQSIKDLSSYGLSGDQLVKSAISEYEASPASDIDNYNSINNSLKLILSYFSCNCRVVLYYGEGSPKSMKTVDNNGESRLSSVIKLSLLDQEGKTVRIPDVIPGTPGVFFHTYWEQEVTTEFFDSKFLRDIIDSLPARNTSFGIKPERSMSLSVSLPSTGDNIEVNGQNVMTEPTNPIGSAINELTGIPAN